MEILRDKRTEFERYLSSSRPVTYCFACFQGDYVDASAGVNESADLWLSDLARADHEATFAFQL